MTHSVENSRRRTAVKTAVLATAACFVATAASAQTLQLELQAGASPAVLIVDNGAGDSNPAAGAITFVGPVGGFTLNVLTALSKPAVGNPARAQMDLNVLSVQPGASETLTARLTDVNFVGVINGQTLLTSEVGGTNSGATAATFQVFLDPSNNPFGTAGPGVCSTGLQTANAGTFDTTAQTQCQINGPYSLTFVDSWTLGAGSIGFDHFISVDLPQCGTIGDFVWHDLNRNGVQDPGEPGINGVTVNLTDGSTTLATTTTGPNPMNGGAGYYQFGNVCEGNYNVDVDESTVPSGFVPTLVNVGDDTTDNDSNGPPVPVVAPPGPFSIQTIDFGFQTPCTGVIGDFVWNDTNQNGIQDPGELGIPGVVLQLTPGNQTTTTGANGFYQFTGLCAGTYEVTVITPPPGMIASPTTQGSDTTVDSNPNPTITELVGDNDSDLTIDFGYYAPCTGKIGDFVWTDLDRDGVQDPGEPGIQGVRLILRDSNGVQIGEAFTDVNGYYEFGGLCGGNYRVEVDPASVPPTLSPSPVGTTTPDKDSNPNPTFVNLPNNGVDLTIDFGFMPPCAGRIGDFVWYDADADGLQDPGEVGIPGVQVELRAMDNSLLAVTTTNATGFYQFIGLCGGTFKVVVIPPAGYNASPTNVGPDRTVDSSPNPETVILPNDFAEDLTIDFGYYQPAALGDFVWNDINANGQQDVGEPGIPNVGVTLLTCAGATVATQNTNANGLYLFTNLVPGCYKVQFATPAGFTPTVPNTGNDATDSDAVGGVTGNYTLAAGQTNLTVDAGFYKVAALGDFVWHDQNANGQQDGGEPGISGVAVTLLSCADVVLGTTNTNATGFYLFSNLAPGCYKVRFATPAGFPQASPANVGNDATDSDSVGGTTGNYTLAAGETNLTVDAGFYKLAALGDFVWKDLDQDGQQDAGEPGISGVAVTLLSCANAVLANTSTNASGLYLFSNLMPGCYKVQFATPAGYTPTSSNVGSDVTDSDAVAGVTGNYTLVSGETNLTVDAGFFVNTPPPCIPTEFVLTGGTSTTGTKGNIRTFTSNGISVKASAFARKDADGSWSTAYLGAYSLGLGVTDIGEDGSGDTHTVDNMGGRDNYVLFEFSQPVIVTQAFLDYVGVDSDITVWVGTKTDPYNNHLTLSDALLNTLTKENNDTTSDASRWAVFTGAAIQGNVLVVAASTSDDTPDDSFKLKKLKLDCVPPPPPTCPTGTFDLTGNTSVTGTKGNIRTFTVNGISVKASGFSRTDSGATWSTAYLGAYGGGLGVTDSGENGASDTHKVDNVGGRDNYVLFEFSQVVTVNRAFLDSVTTDSDISVWIGTKTDPYNNHLTLSDALLASLAKEDNDTTSNLSRWADFNGAGMSGNVLVIAASTTDDTPDDWFKISKLELGCPTVSPCVAGTFSLIGNTAVTGTSGNVRTFTISGVSVKASAFSRSDSSGSWAAAYLGAYSIGLGVTDTSENGANDTHTVDNKGGRQNYVLFEFSKEVTVTQAFLDYVGADSDITVWVGTKNDPFNNHLTLSDALLSGFTKETNDAANGDSRWASFNAADKSGNVLVIAASTSDSTPDDSFKLSKLKLTCQ